MLWIPVSAGLMFAIGCGDSPKTADATKPASSTAPSTAPSSASTASATAPRPTSSSASLPSEPKEVVQLFLDSMRQGNGAQLSALMTSAAREEIRRKELVIDPLGSPLATFKIGEAAQQEDAMLVSSVWTEPGEKGEEPSELEVVWELRKETEGWRVCGMAVDPMTGEDVQVVNFESMEQDPTGVAAEPSRVASLPNAAPAATQFQQNQPQLNQSAPSFPGNPATQVLPPVTQVLPPVTQGFPPATQGFPPATQGFPPATQGFPPASQGLPPASSLPPAGSSGLPPGGFAPR